MYQQIRLPVGCFLILLYASLQYLGKERLRTVAARIFEMLVAGGLVHLVAAAVTEYTVNNRERVPVWFNTLWHIIFLLSLSFTMWMVYSYLTYYVARAIGRPKRGERYAVNTLTILCMIGEIVSPIAYLDTPHGSYSLGMKAYFLYLQLAIVIIMLCVNLIVYWNRVEKRLRRTLSSSIIVFLGISTVQVLYPYLLMTDVAITMIALGIMLNNEDAHRFINRNGRYNGEGCKEILRELLLSREQFHLGVCVFFSESRRVSEAKLLVKNYIASQHLKLVCGSPMNDMLLIMPTAMSGDFPVNPETMRRLPDSINGVKCVSDVLRFRSTQSVEDIISQIYEYKNRCEESEHQTDELTGLLRRNAYMAHVNQLLQEQEPFAFVMIDLDDFKHINDTYGHNAGDEVLRHAANTFRSGICSEDLACRMGGDEFSVVLRGVTEKKDIHMVLERFYKSLAQTRITGQKTIEVNLSMGVKVYAPNDPDASFESLYLASDDALYQAKNAGKNQVVVVPADE